jgi:hypothetical protein
MRGPHSGDDAMSSLCRLASHSTKTVQLLWRARYCIVAVRAPSCTLPCTLSCTLWRTLLLCATTVISLHATAVKGGHSCCRLGHFALLSALVSRSPHSTMTGLSTCCTMLVTVSVVLVIMILHTSVLALAPTNQPLLDRMPGHWQLRHWRHAQASRPCAAAGTTGLTSLELSQNGIRTLPDSIGCCTSLVTLGLAQNKLQVRLLSPGCRSRPAWVAMLTDALPYLCKRRHHLDTNRVVKS